MTVYLVAGGLGLAVLLPALLLDEAVDDAAGPGAEVGGELGGGLLWLPVTAAFVSLLGLAGAAVAQAAAGPGAGWSAAVGAAADLHR